MEMSTHATFAQVFATMVVALAFSSFTKTDREWANTVLYWARFIGTVGLLGGIARMLLHMSGAFLLEDEELTYVLVLAGSPAAFAIAMNVLVMKSPRELRASAGTADTDRGTA